MDQNPHLLLMLEGLHAVSETLNALWDNSALSIHCPKCTRLNAPTINNNKFICGHCKTKVTEPNVGIYVIINQLDIKILHKAIQGEHTKKSFLGNVFKPRENKASFNIIEETEAYSSKRRAEQAHIILIKKEFTDVCEKTVELIKQREPSRNTCYIIQATQDGEISELPHKFNKPFIPIIEDEKDDLPAYLNSTIGCIKYTRGQAPKQIIKDMAIYNALMPKR
jgi:hypothetical protein